MFKLQVFNTHNQSFSYYLEPCMVLFILLLLFLLLVVQYSQICIFSWHYYLYHPLCAHCFSFLCVMYMLKISTNLREKYVCSKNALLQISLSLNNCIFFHYVTGEISLYTEPRQEFERNQQLTPMFCHLLKRTHWNVFMWQILEDFLCSLGDIS